MLRTERAKSTVDEQAAKITIALLADAPEALFAARGVLSRHEAEPGGNSRLLRKTEGSGTVATIALAMNGPTPGMVASRRLVSVP